MCKSALHSLLNDTQDEFFESLSYNFAKFIYQIIGYKWDCGETVSYSELMHCVSKANKNDFKLLSLIFGDVGMIDLADQSQVMIRNKLSPETKTVVTPDKPKPGDRLMREWQQSRTTEKPPNERLFKRWEKTKKIIEKSRSARS